MGKKIKLKKRKKFEKERPFDDSDTVIQWREDFVQDYIKEPLMRKATEEPVVERVVTEKMEKDMLVDDEDNDIGTRTRPKQLPVMPLDAEFMKGMQNSVASKNLIDIRDNLRFYNDAIRSPSGKELGKVFLLGLIRQLRYWATTQTPQPEIDKGQTSVDWVKDDMIPRIQGDMSLLAKHFTPEIDKIYFRRWSLELNILQTELKVRKEESDATREQLLRDGFDPKDLDKAQQIDFPNRNVLEWLKSHPDEGKIIFDDPEQRQSFLNLAWSEMFNNDGNLEYLHLITDLHQRADMDAQNKEQLDKINELLQNGSEADLRGMQQNKDFANFLLEIQKASTTLKGTHQLPLLIKLLSTFGNNAQELSNKVQSNYNDFASLIRSM